jgi:hypothetical protein
MVDFIITMFFHQSDQFVKFFALLQIFALLLQIFALLFGIKCTETNQSQSSNIPCILLV